MLISIFNILIAVFAMRVAFRENGLYLYRVNFVPWDEIVSARLIRFPYFRYMLLKLSKRRFPYFSKTWWVPLYLNPVKEDILKYAPKDHPVRKLYE